ncbi:hypothetical protein OG21DRAFT_1513830 [Imleria badia]|nr:hypothetical protein OG21DRAFT_1515309 [Imleria badia]KAF8550567.1 hypothetical protein OG21DRAFT_1513830 [Imleria badia]
MAGVHVYGNRGWLGWYNTPGSLQIAKRFSSFPKFVSLSQTRFSDIVCADPTALFEMVDCKGPKFRAAYSGTVIQETGPVATLLMKACAALDSEGKVAVGRKAKVIGVTIADLGWPPDSEMRPKPVRSSTSALLFASVPIAVSIGTCALCAVFEDRYASSLILVGIVASGISYRILASADFLFTHPEPARGSPPGDGILVSDKDFVLLRGPEGAVNCITRGNFSLRFSSMAHYSRLRWCSVLFFIQGATQLLLIPQASLFGQVMFLTSLGVSALYNSSWGEEKTYRRLILESVLQNPKVTKCTFGTRTAAVVFMLLVLKPQDPTALLNELLPNDTEVWQHWKVTISTRLRRPLDQLFLPESEIGNLDEFTAQDRELLYMLFSDARAAYKVYGDYNQVISQ